MEEIDIKEILGLFWSKKLEIIIITIVLVIIGSIYSFAMITPKYSSSTTLVLANQKNNSETGNELTQADITINSKLVGTYSQLVKSKAVLRETLNKLELSDKISEDALRKCITVKSVEDTEIIKITVQHEDAEIAAKVANEVAGIFSIKVSEIYNVNNVYIVDIAEPSTIPSNINHTKDIAIFMLIGLVLGFAEVLIVKLLDNKVRTEQDVENFTKLLVLGVLPQNEYIQKGGRK